MTPELDAPVTVLLIQHGEQLVDVDPTELAYALSTLGEGDFGQLDELFDEFRDSTAEIDLDTVLRLPDGRLIDLFRVLRRDRPSLRSHPGQALTRVIAASRTRSGCRDCAARISSPCPAHLTEDILSACRLEYLEPLAGDAAVLQPNNL